MIRPRSANVDQIFVLISLKEPDFSYYLAYLYLSYAFFINIPVTLILTKKDLLTESDVKAIEDHFTKEGFSVYAVNNSDSNLEVIHRLLKDKTTILMGQTGVGKSSLINESFPNLSREIGEYSKRGGQGKHMTKEVRFSQLMRTLLSLIRPGSAALSFLSPAKILWIIFRLFALISTNVSSMIAITSIARIVRLKRL